MKQIQQIIFLLPFMILFGVFFLSCSPPEEKGHGFKIVDGNANFIKDCNSLDNPYGILPTGHPFTSANVINHNTTNYYEFFIFDHETSLFILSESPFTYIKVRSMDLNYHLKKEYDQLKAGSFGTSKIRTVLAKYINLGTYKLGVYFSPKEIYFTTSGTNKYRITTYSSSSISADYNISPWKLFEAANSVFFYSPDYEEEKIHSDFQDHINNGKKRQIYTDNSVLSPAIYTEGSYGLGYSVLLGEDLQFSSVLMDSGEDVNFVNKDSRTQEFLFLSSIPLGNSQGANTLSDYDGIVIVLRGDPGTLDQYRNYYTAKGFELDGDLAMSISTTVSGSDIEVSWIATADVDVYVSTDGTNYTFNKSLSASTSTTISGLPTGSKYWIKLVNPATSLAYQDSSNNDLIAEVVLPREPIAGDIIFTEFMHMGTTGASSNSTDDWIEIKNISSDYLNLENIDYLYSKGTTALGVVFGPSYGSTASGRIPLSGYIKPGEYIVIARYDNKMFAEISVSNFYKRTLGSLTNSTTHHLALKVGSVWITNQDIVVTGATTPKKSRVLSTSDTWILTLEDVTHDVDSAGLTNYGSGKNYCSPGYAAAGEK